MENASVGKPAHSDCHSARAFSHFRSLPVAVEAGQTVRFVCHADGTRALGRVSELFRACGVVWVRVRRWIECVMLPARIRAMHGCRDCVPGPSTELIPLPAIVDFQCVQHWCRFGAHLDDANLCYRTFDESVGGDRRAKTRVRHSNTSTTYVWNRFASADGFD
jgi:hypothetical protein